MSYPCGASTSTLAQIGHVQGGRMHLDGFSTQHDEALRSLHQESCEFMAENALDLICLLDLNANTDRVDRGLDKHSLVFVS